MTNNQTITFTKMHGLGNDFVVINTLSQTLPAGSFDITRMADRHLGIGFDQLLLIEASQKADFFCRIYNADGSEAEQCGNGLRCVARYLHEEGIHPNKSLTLETIAGVFPIVIEDYDHIRITMGEPNITSPLVEVNLPSQVTSNISIIDTGNPHAIVKVDQLDTDALEQLSPEISTLSHFPKGANVGFMQIMTANHARLRTFERGAGETRACGSNACAAAVAGILNGWLNDPVKIEFHCGSLTIEWEGKGKPVHLTGPASRVFEGKL